MRTCSTSPNGPRFIGLGLQKTSGTNESILRRVQTVGEQQKPDNIVENETEDINDGALSN